MCEISYFDVMCVMGEMCMWGSKRAFFQRLFLSILDSICFGPRLDLYSIPKAPMYQDEIKYDRQYIIHRTVEPDHYFPPCALCFNMTTEYAIMPPIAIITPITDLSPTARPEVIHPRATIEHVFTCPTTVLDTGPV